MSEKTFKPGDRVELHGATKLHFGTIIDVSDVSPDYVRVRWDSGTSNWMGAFGLEHLPPLSVNPAGESSGERTPPLGESGPTDENQVFYAPSAGRGGK